MRAYIYICTLKCANTHMNINTRIYTTQAIIKLLFGNTFACAHITPFHTDTNARAHASLNASTRMHSHARMLKYVHSQKCAALALRIILYSICLHINKIIPCTHCPFKYSHLYQSKFLKYTSTHEARHFKSCKCTLHYSIDCMFNSHANREKLYHKV